MNREQAATLWPIIKAYGEGKAIEIYTNGWNDLAEPVNWNCVAAGYRIKPTPTYRPWLPHEVPVGKIIRSKIDGPRHNPNNYSSLILGVDADGIQIINRSIHGEAKLDTETFKFVFDNGEHSPDNGKTWLPCGVLES
jgi:hypothetical protein